MNILSIDFSLQGTAMVYGDINSTPLYTYFSPLKSDIKNNPHCIEIVKDSTSEDKLDNVICEFIRKLRDIDLVILEAPSFNSINSNSSFKYGYGIMMYIMRRLNIKNLQVSPISSKLYFTGNAKASKEEMIIQAKKEYNKIIDFENISSKKQEDISDSLSLYQLGKDYIKFNDCLSNNKPTDLFFSLSIHRQQVLAKICENESLYKEIVKTRNKIKKYNLDL